jgi:hypothetical protein
MANDAHSGEITNESNKMKWLARFGVGAFAFFFIKGMLWLIVPALLLWWGTK